MYTHYFQTTETNVITFLGLLIIVLDKIYIKEKQKRNEYIFTNNVASLAVWFGMLGSATIYIIYYIVYTYNILLFGETNFTYLLNG